MKTENIQRVSVPQQVEVALRMEIAEKLRPGDRLATEADLVKRFGVSLHAVREALALLAREGVLVRRQGRGTYVADPHASQHVALWLGVDINHPTADSAHRLLAHTHVALVRLGIPVRVYVAPVKDNRLVDKLASRELAGNLRDGRVCAVGRIAGLLPDELTDLMRMEDVGVVGGRPRDGLPGHCEERLVVRATMGVRHLVQQGCRRIAYLGYVDPSAGFEAAALVDRVMAEHGVVGRPEWICGDLHPTRPGAGYDQFREIWSARAEKPDGLLIGDDVYLPDVVTALLEMGIAVPQQLQVVTAAHAGINSCPFFPAARLEYDLEETARWMADRLGKLARGETVADEPMPLTPKLVPYAPRRRAGLAVNP